MVSSPHPTNLQMIYQSEIIKKGDDFDRSGLNVSSSPQLNKLRISLVLSDDELKEDELFAQHIIIDPPIALQLAHALENGALECIEANKSKEDNASG